MFNNRQNAAFQELIGKEQQTRNRWAANFGRSFALQTGNLSDNGMIIENEDFLQGTVFDDTVPLPKANPNAARFMRTALRQGPAQFNGSVTYKSVNDDDSCESQNPLQYNDMTSTSLDPLAFTMDAFDAKNTGIEDGRYPVVRKRITRTVEVPVLRQVKIPIKITQANGKPYHVVKETYTDYVDQPAVREREVWVKKVVKEEYTRKVPVTKTRTKKVPVQEGKGYIVVNDQDADAYRIDEVADVETIEVEEWADFELRPVLKSEPVPVNYTYTNGAAHDTIYCAGNGDVGARSIRSIVSKSDPSVRYISNMDNSQPQPFFEQQPQRTQHKPTQKTRTCNLSNTGKGLVKPRALTVDQKIDKSKLARQAFNMTQREKTQKSATQSVPQPQRLPPLTNTQTLSSTQRVGENKGIFAFLGLKSATAASGNGVLLTFVPQQSLGELAGLCVRDIVTSINNRPVKSTSDFVQSLDATDGSIVFSVMRGAIPVKITIPSGKIPKF